MNKSIFSSLENINETSKNINIIKDQSKEIPVILSLASYKERLPNIPLVIHSIYQNTKIPYKIILNILENDYQYLTNKTLEFINNGFIELNINELDLKPHRKYFEVMKKYRNYPIITIDDDIYYSEDLIESLYNTYLENKDCIICRRAHRITYTNCGLWEHYNKFQKRLVDTECGFDILATGVGGILYPPNILNISDNDLDLIYKMIYTDDLFLKYKSLQNNIKTLNIKNNHPSGLYKFLNKETIYHKLVNMNIICKNNNKMIDLINSLIKNGST